MHEAGNPGFAAGGRETKSPTTSGLQRPFPLKFKGKSGLEVLPVTGTQCVFEPFLKHGALELGSGPPGPVCKSLPFL